MPKKIKSTFEPFLNSLWKLIDQANHRNLNSIKKILSSSAYSISCGQSADPCTSQFLYDK